MDTDRVLCATRLLTQYDQSLGARVRQWSKQDGIDECEDGAVRADAERKREDRDSGHPTPFDEYSRGELNVLKHGWTWL